MPPHLAGAGSYSEPIPHAPSWRCADARSLSAADANDDFAGCSGHAQIVQRYIRSLGDRPLGERTRRSLFSLKAISRHTGRMSAS